MTLLSVCRAAAAVIGLDIPTSVAASTDREHVELMAVANEMAGILSHYKDADVARVKIYVESVLRNSAVMAFLEAQ